MLPVNPYSQYTHTDKFSIKLSWSGPEKIFKVPKNARVGHIIELQRLLRVAWKKGDKELKQAIKYYELEEVE
jgi:hypothetical protein